MGNQQHELFNALPKQKRIKVSKACQTCREKKIKCDGLNPCMQCKARQRPCSFSVGDPNYLLRPSMKSSTNNAPRSRSSSPSLPPAQHIVPLNRATSPASSQLTYAKRLLDSTTSRLEVLGQSWPGCEYEDSKSTLTGNLNAFNSWPYQQKQQKQQQQQHQPSPRPPLSFFLVDLFKEPQNDYSYDDRHSASMENKIVSSESNIQHNLINLYYHYRYQLLPLLPKSTLFALIRCPSPKAFISPLLLCTLYAHAAQCSPTLSSDADHHATTAKSMLDDYLDTPQLSTIIALVLLSLYESNHNGYSCSPYQSSTYSAIAFRMCLDMNLCNCNNADNDSTLNTGSAIKALQLRVFWSCYCLDKWQSLCTDRPWMIHCTNINENMKLNGKSILDMEGAAMDHNEQMIIEGLVASIHLAQFGERLLQQSSLSSSSSLSRSYVDQQLLPFLQRLPSSLHWTPLPTPDSLSSPASSLYQPIPSHPPHNAIVAHFHLIFNLLHLTLLARSLLKIKTSSSLDQQQPDYDVTKNNEYADLVLQRCTTVATNLTQLTCALSDQTAFILCFGMAAHALMMSVRVHLIQCYSVVQPGGNEQLRVAKHARLMFQRSLRSLRILVQHRVIPGSDTFAVSVEKMLASLTLSSRGSNDYTIVDQHITNPILNINSSQNQQGYNIPPPYQYQAQQQKDYLRGAEQSAADIFPNTNNNTINAVISKPSQSSLRSSLTIHAPSHLENQQQQQSLVHVAALHTSAISNPLYHQQSLPRFRYSLPTGKHDEVLESQKQYQQEQQPQYRSSSSLTSPPLPSCSHDTGNIRSTFIQSSSLFSPSRHLENKSTSTAKTTTGILSPPPHTSSSTINSVHPLSPSTTSLGMVSPPRYKNIGLGVYASAHRHHSDVISQHYAGKK